MTFYTEKQGYEHDCEKPAKKKTSTNKKTTTKKKETPKIKMGFNKEQKKLKLTYATIIQNKNLYFA